MTAPISNNPSSYVTSDRTGRGAAASAPQGEEARETAQTEAAEAAPTGNDRVSLSDTARQMNADNGKIQNSEQAMEALAKLRSKMGSNPGLAVAAHTNNASSRLSALLEQVNAA